MQRCSSSGDARSSRRTDGRTDGGSNTGTAQKQSGKAGRIVAAEALVFAGGLASIWIGDLQFEEMRRACREGLDLVAAPYAFFLLSYIIGQVVAGAVWFIVGGPPMNAKIFEVRDRNTFIPVLAVNLESEIEAERYLMSRAGYGANHTRHRQFVLVTRLTGGEAHYDCHSWGNRTMHLAHVYIERNWWALSSGQVVDVRFISGETDSPVSSERHTNSAPY